MKGNDRDNRMKGNESIDKWLRDSMKEFQPDVSAESRHRFLSEATVGKTASSWRRFTYAALGLLILVSVIGIFLWFGGNEPSIEENAKPNGKEIVKTELQSSQSEQIVNNSSPVNNISATGLPDHVPGNLKYTVQPEESGSQSRESALEDEVQINAQTSSSQLLTLKDPSNNDLLTFEKPIVFETANGTLLTNDLKPIYSNELDEAPIPVVDSVKPPALTVIIPVLGNPISIPAEDTAQSPAPPVQPKNHVKYGNSNNYLFLYYRPEMIWNIIENEKLVHNFGLEWRTGLFNGRYSLGTGVGLSQSKGYYEYAVDYLEYLGSYQKLDSISFNWDPANFLMEQSRHTSEQVVFDSSVKTNYARVYRKFTYLQVPLIMQYDLISAEKYSLGLRFTPILSILLTKKAVDFKYDAGMNQVIQINRITPERVQTNWQLAAGISYKRRLMGNLLFEAEPRIAYYFNSVYEKPDDSASPFGASIRIAIGIKY